MKRTRFTEDQIVTILKEQQAGAKVSELCRKHGISDATFYTWRTKFNGMGHHEVRRLRHLEEENRRLKQLVANQVLDLVALKEVLSKKF
jgi:putative transposase